jgi:hypothetical protein
VSEKRVRGEKEGEEKEEREEKELRRSVWPTIEIPNYADVIQCMLDFTALLPEAHTENDFRKREKPSE